MPSWSRPIKLDAQVRRIHLFVFSIDLIKDAVPVFTQFDSSYINLVFSCPICLTEEPLSFKSYTFVLFSPGFSGFKPVSNKALHSAGKFSSQFSLSFSCNWICSSVYSGIFLNSPPMSIIIFSAISLNLINFKNIWIEMNFSNYYAINFYWHSNLKLKFF